MESFSKSKSLALAAGVACGLLLAWKLHGYYSPSSTNSPLERSVEENESEGNVMRENEKYKLALIVRSNQKRSNGKVAAQCSYAAICAYKQLQKRHPELLKEWEFSGQPTIVNQAHNQTSLIRLCTHAKELGLCTSLIQDDGGTNGTLIQDDGGTNGTYTASAVSPSVLAVGPGPARLIEAVTGSLKLY